MSIGIFIQSDPGVPGMRREAMIYPGNPDNGETVPVIFARVTDGSRGRQYRWERCTSLEDFLAGVPVSERLIGYVGIGVTATNARDIKDTGQSGSMTTRALADATVLLPPNDVYLTTHITVSALYDRLLNSDQTLTEIVDGKVWGEISPVLSVDAKPGKDTVFVNGDEDVTDLPAPQDDEDEDAPLTDEERAAMNEAARLLGVQQRREVVMGGATEGARVSRFVPFDLSTLMVSKKVLRKYVGRMINGVRDFEVLDKAYAKRRNVRIVGPTGPGKTMFVRAWAARRGLPLVRIQGDGAINLQMLLGQRDIDESGTFWVDGSVSAIARNGGVILIDEINFIPPKMLAAFYSMLDEDRTIRLMDNNGEVIVLHKDVMIVSTMNDGYLGTMELNFAVKNRFPIVLNWGYEEAVEKTLGVPPVLMDIARGLRQQQAADNGLDTPTPTNRLTEFEGIVEDFGLDFAVENFCNHYDETERAPIKLVFETNMDGLRQAYGVKDADDLVPA